MRSGSLMEPTSRQFSRTAVEFPIRNDQKPDEHWADRQSTSRDAHTHRRTHASRKKLAQFTENNYLCTHDRDSCCNHPHYRWSHSSYLDSQEWHSQVTRARYARPPAYGLPTSTNHTTSQTSPSTTVVRDRPPTTTNHTTSQSSTSTTVVRDRPPTTTNHTTSQASPSTTVVRDRPPTTQTKRLNYRLRLGLASLARLPTDSQQAPNSTPVDTRPANSAPRCSWRSLRSRLFVGLPPHTPQPERLTTAGAPPPPHPRASLRSGLPHSVPLRARSPSSPLPSAECFARPVAFS